MLVAEGRALAERSGDLFGLAMVVAASGGAKLLAGKVEETLEPMLEAEWLAEQMDNADLKLWTKSGLIISYLFLGRLGEALRYAEEAEQLAQENVDAGYRLFGRSLYIAILYNKGGVLCEMGRLAEATRDLVRALDLASERGEVETAGWAHCVYALTCSYSGDAPVALRHARQALETAERMGYTSMSVLGLLVLGSANLLQEEWSEAAAALEQGLAIARERRTGLVWEARILTYLAEAYARHGEGRKALATTKEALAVAQRRGSGWSEGPAHLALARVLMCTKGANAKREIKAALSRALATVEESGARVHEPFIREEMAELARLTGDDETRQGELREAQRLFTEMGATGHAARLAAELAQG